MAALLRYHKNLLIVMCAIDVLLVAFFWYVGHLWLACPALFYGAWCVWAAKRLTLIHVVAIELIDKQEANNHVG